MAGIGDALATPAAMVPMPALATNFTDTLASGLTSGGRLMAMIVGMILVMIAGMIVGMRLKVRDRQWVSSPVLPMK